MPLSQNDPKLDYGGSWDNASKDWPSIVFPSEEAAKRAYVIAWRDAKVPYGSYVLVDNVLRLETEELKNLCLETLRLDGEVMDTNGVSTKVRIMPDYHNDHPIALATNLQLAPGNTMAERSHCSVHQRYLEHGVCVDCEKLQLALSYAEDIVKSWPTMTIRTINQMTDRVNALQEALELTKTIKTYRGDR